MLTTGKQIFPTLKSLGLVFGECELTDRNIPSSYSQCYQRKERRNRGSKRDARADSLADRAPRAQIYLAPQQVQQLGKLPFKGEAGQIWLLAPNSTQAQPVSTPLGSKPLLRFLLLPRQPSFLNLLLDSVQEHPGPGTETI